MDNKFVDTNVFIEVLERKGEKSNRSLSFLKGESGLWTNILVMAEIEWVLRDYYELEKKRIVDCLQKVLNLNNVKIDHKLALVEALDFYSSSNVDWVDCINAALTKDFGCKEVFSYDHHFDKFDWLKRKEP